ncbi:Laminin subunit gamma-1 [Linum perenne]
MAAAKFLVFSLFLALLLSAVWADSSTDIDGDVVEPAIQVTKSTDLQSSALKAELDQLKSKIQDLESQIDRKTKDLKEKEEKLAKKEKVIKEKTDSITSLQSEVSSLQKKGKLDSAEQLNKANAQVVDLEKQLDRLKAEFEAQNVEKETLENRASKAETKLDELNSKLKDLQKISDEQKSKIRKTERALKVAEEEMLKAKLEASSRTKELTEVHGAWLPPWLAVQFAHFQSFAQKHWHAHGKPTMAIVTQKAQENKEKAAKWAQPHLEAVKTKWVPAVKGQWVVVTTQVQPHVRSLSAKTVEVYETSKTAITGHVIKIQDIVDPYFQEAKKFSQPYIEQVATVTKPHVDKIRVVVKPYTKEAVRAYGKFLESATTYHQQVQGTVQETLKKHELTKSLATKELIWFLASALLALPIFVLARVCSAVFGLVSKKTKRTSRGTHSSSHSRRKGKRVHSEK